MRANGATCRYCERLSYWRKLAGEDAEREEPTDVPLV